MRIMLTLRTEQDQKDVSTDYNRMHDFVSDLLLRASKSDDQNKDDYRVFSFSNIFPCGDAKQGDMKKMVIASPSRQVIKHLKNLLTKMIWGVIEIGDCRFSLQSVQELGMKIREPLRIISATPIVVRIPDEMYGICRVPEKERWPGYTYWRPCIDQEVFTSLLSMELIKKYNDFHGTTLSHPSIFEKARFRRSVYTRITNSEGEKQGVAASTWEFQWTDLDEIQKEILAFSLDAGFGEKNEMGFGFVNVIRERR